MHGTQPVQVQIETQGAVPEGMPELAIAKVDSRCGWPPSLSCTRGSRSRWPRIPP